MGKNVIILLAVLSNIGLGVDNAPPLIQRFAFVVGQNDGGSKKQKLKYASSDALSFAEIMADLGGVEQRDSMIVINPSRLELMSRISAMEKMISRKKLPNVRSELFFYYSGHSDDEGLLLQEEKFAYSDLRGRIKSMFADLSIIILDSCASGNLTRLKGGHKAPPFLNDALSKLKGYVVLTSSSSNEVAQESDRIKGSYFTHYLVSGLRGAADVSLDNRITLNEAYQYAYHQTLARTEKTASGPQHPSYSIQLTGSGELVMTDIRRVSAKVLLGKNILGRVFIRDKKDRIVAEVDKMTPKPMAIGLEAGNYSLILFKDRQISKAQIKLSQNQFSEVGVSDFSPIEAESSVARGTATLAESIEEDLVHIPAEFSILPGLSTNVVSSDVTTNNFSMSLLYARPNRVSGVAWSLLGGTRVGDTMKGFQLSPFFNQVGATGTGVQISLGYNQIQNFTGLQIGGVNSTKNITGIQLGGFNHSAGEVAGVQFGGANLAQKLEIGAQIGGANEAHSPLTGAQIGGINLLFHPIRGAQIGWFLNRTTHIDGFQAGGINSAEAVNGAQLGGLINRSGQTKGLQIAFLNYAESISGAQIGAANVASDIDGLQLGAVNYGATEEGVTIGLLNLPQKGQLRVGYSFDDLGMHQLALKYGTRYTYSFLQYGNKHDLGSNFHGKAAGLGGDIPYKRISLNIEGLFLRLDKGSFVNNGGIWIFQARLVPRYRLTDWFGVFGGISINVKLTRTTYDFPLGEPNKNPWVGYLGGIEFLI